jgi:hypothetical protein
VANPTNDDVVALKARIQRLEVALRPFAVAADRGQEISEVFGRAGYGAMECRDAFMYHAPRGLCVRDFLNAREALTALKEVSDGPR